MAHDDSSCSPFAAVKRIKLSKDSTDLVNREMQYDAAGNVTKIVDGVNSETVDYTYDDLDRLLTASVPTGESFAYDTIGNMTSKAGAALDYGTTSPKHAVKSHGTTTYTYDANGSMTARGTQTIKYDPEQRPILVQDGSNYSRAAYDGDGVRRKRDDSNGTVHYLGGYERKLAGRSESSDTVTKYYSASLGAMSRPVAFRRGGTLHWVGADHLGGTIRVLNDSFTALDGMRYKPYGEDRDTGNALATDRKFTGQTEDEAAGLYWYASRAYDPAIGRFVSPDSIVPAPGNPQSLNRYSYVYNNPLGLVDPTGRSAEWFDQAWLDEFRRVHGDDPDESDINYRYHSMNATSRGDDWSLDIWKTHPANTTPTTPVTPPTPDYGDSPILDALEQVNTTWMNAGEQLANLPRNANKVILKHTAGLEADLLSRVLYPGADDRSEKNAFKHAYWSALMTVVGGSEMAKEITDEHEEWNMAHAQEPIDLAMDLINNEVGREIARGSVSRAWLFAPKLLRNYLSKLTALAISEGKLVEIREGRLVPTDDKW